ncbi:MAG TPA: hypothetical protein VE913_15890, partial [Longimicrobium sp.]|nr:hypothetical protein [Longimicrobium sp.]
MPHAWFRTRCAAERWFSRRIPLSEGQLWRFENQTDRDARLLIHSVRPDQRAGRIFYVVPFT